MLLISLAYFLPPDELGTYGLLVATIGYAVYIIGFEFYVFSSRELIRYENIEGGKLIKSQLCIHLISYAVVLPISFLLFYLELLPWIYFVPFVLLIVLEHISQELNRIIVALSAQLWASMILFLRSGLWAIIAVFIMWAHQPARNIQFILYLWLGCGTLSCFVGALWLYNRKMPGWELTIDWTWIFKGLKISLPFFIAAVASQGMYTLDRYLIDHFFSKEILGAYVFFISLAFAVSTFLDAGVFVFFYPELIKLNSENRSRDFKNLFFYMTKQVFFASTTIVIISAIAIHSILPIIDKEIYSQNVSIFYCLLLAVWLQIIGMIPQYGLYAIGKDGPINISQILAGIVFSVSALILSLSEIVLAIPIALCCGLMFSLIYKVIAYSAVHSSLFKNTEAHL